MNPLEIGHVIFHTLDPGASSAHPAEASPVVHASPWDKHGQVIGAAKRKGARLGTASHAIRVRHISVMCWSCAAGGCNSHLSERS